MKTTTVKLDGKILSEIEAIRPQDRPLTTFVKEILHAEYQRRMMQAAGEQYAQLLRANEQEATLLDEWESSDLSQPRQKAKK